MREMVLNHASLRAYDRLTAVEWLKGMAAGMAELLKEGVAQAALRMSRSIYETPCMLGWPLSEAYQALRQKGSREEYLFLMRLSTKVPLLSEVDQGIKGRFLACESKALPPEDGEPLVLCAITNGIAVGFPSDDWNRDQLTVRFNKMLGDDGSIVEVSETIDNLALHAHARSICQRHRAALLQCKNGAELWEKREKAFPHLKFGLEVERHLERLDMAVLQTVSNRLGSLDTWAGEGRTIGSTATPRGAEKVEGRDSTYRLRAGQFRILYTVDGSIIEVFRIAYRPIAYR